jgi:Type IV secretion system pilin
MSFKKQKIIIVLAFSLLILSPAFVSASGLVPCGSNGQSPCTVTDIFVLIAQVTNWLIAMAGVYAVFRIIWAGFNLVISAGSEESITKWKGSIQNAIIGFVFVMFAYVFINTAVNVLLLNNIANTSCQLNLQSPLTYLQINPANCQSGQ